MAKTVNIPDTDNIIRYAKKKHLSWKFDCKGNPVKIIGCFPDLFKLRNDPQFNKKNSGPEKYLSVNWIEFFPGDEAKQLRQAIDDFYSVRTVGKNDTFVKLIVNDVKKVCRSHKAEVRILHEPTRHIKSHGSIRRLPQDNDLLLDDLCEMAFKTLFQQQDL
jgi:hypothetical protein